MAHNPGGAAALAAALDDLGIPAGSVLVIGVLDDKDLAGMAAPLARHFRRAIAVTPPHPLRARPAAETAGVLGAAGIETAAIPDVDRAIPAAVELAAKEGGWLVVTGSLFTVGPARVVLGDPIDRSRPRG